MADKITFKRGIDGERWNVMQGDSRLGWVVPRGDGWQAVAADGYGNVTLAGPPEPTRRQAAEQLVADVRSAKA